MLFGMVFFSFTIGSLTSMLQNIDTKETVLTNKLAVIDEFSKQSHLGKSIKTKLRNALRYSTDKQGFSWTDKISIFNELPRNLKYEVAMAMHKGAAKQLPFFADKDPVFISSVIPFLKSIMVPEGEYIYQEGEYADEIYFLVKGRAAFVAGKEKTPYKSLQSNSYFGDIEVFHQIPRKYSAMALVDCDLLALSRHMVALIRNEFPDIGKEMGEVAEQRDILNSQTRRALKHLQKLKRTGEISHMTQEEIRESVEGYAKAATGEEAKPPSTVEELSQFMQNMEQQLAEVKQSAKFILDILGTPAMHLTVPSVLV
jgi:hyperpolarization activated cyclic nucleotide-gated potassium channel 1